MTRAEIVAACEWSSAPWDDENHPDLFQVWCVYRPPHGGDACAAIVVRKNEPDFCLKLRAIQDSVVDSAIRVHMRDGNFTVVP